MPLILIALVLGLGSVYLGIRGFRQPTEYMPTATFLPLEQYTSPSKSFSVSFPGTPQTRSQTFETAAGKVEVTTYEVRAESAYNFAVLQMDYPSKYDVEVVLRQFPIEARKKFGESSVVESDKKFEVGGFPAREVTLVAGSAKVRARLVIAGTRQFQISAGGALKYVNSPQADGFFDSFKLLP